MATKLSGLIGNTFGLIPGYNGSVGYTGSVGNSGTSGYTGSLGTGYTGSVGAGYVGSIGGSGYTGSAGSGGGASLNSRCSFYVGCNAGSVENTSAIHNVAIGYQSLSCNTSGCNNVAIGANALLASTTGSNNTAIGNGALSNNKFGCHNTAIGFCAGYNMACGCNNIGIGFKSLYGSFINGSGNIGLGYQSLSGITSGNGNLAFGCCALLCNSTGNNNAALGTAALGQNGCGCGNFAFGFLSMGCNTYGTGNISLGCKTLFNNRSGCGNFAQGYTAMYCTYNGSHNIAFGEATMKYNCSGGCNIALGKYAMFTNLYGGHNIALGSCALSGSTYGNCNVAIGFNAGRCLGNCSCGNTVIGNLYGCNACTNTVWIGGGSCERIRVDCNGLYVNGTLMSSGGGGGGYGTCCNIHIGFCSGSSNPGYHSLAIGAFSGQYNQGTYGIALGRCAGNSYQGNNAIAMGYGAGASCQGCYSIALGYYAGNSNQCPHSIILNGTQSSLSATSCDAFFVKPIRSDATPSNILYYSSTTGEITYGANSGGGGGGGGSTSPSGYFAQAVLGGLSDPYSTKVFGASPCTPLPANLSSSNGIMFTVFFNAAPSGYSQLQMLSDPAAMWNITPQYVQGPMGTVFNSQSGNYPSNIGMLGTASGSHVSAGDSIYAQYYNDQYQAPMNIFATAYVIESASVTQQVYAGSEQIQSYMGGWGPNSGDITNYIGGSGYIYGNVYIYYGQYSLKKDGVTAGAGVTIYADDTNQVIWFRAPSWQSYPTILQFASGFTGSVTYFAFG